MSEPILEYRDELPELGTRAAAVAAIESMMFRAIGAKDLEPVQLRYWLDAYYQARQLAEDHIRFDFPWKQIQNEIPRTVGRTKTEEDDGADVSAPPEQAAASGGHANPPAASRQPPLGKGAGETGAAETQQTVEPAAKPQRQRPVGWTDDFEPVELKKSGAAEAAAYKREVLARLQEIRSRGVTVPQIVKVAEGNITEDQVRAILEARRVPVAVYRVLSAALDQIDK